MPSKEELKRASVQHLPRPHDHKLIIFLSQNFKLLSLLSITFAVMIINQNVNIVFEYILFLPANY